MIVYKKTNGQAHDLRFTDKPDKNDITLKGDRLPDIEALHDRAYIEARDKAKGNQSIKDKLSGIDAGSIRAIREYITGDIKAKEAAVILLTTKEAEAAAERVKLVT